MRFLGIVGLIVLLFGLFGALFLGSFDKPFFYIHIGLGVAFLLLWLFSTGLKSLSSWGSAVTSRQARYGYNVILYSAVTLGLLVAVNWYASEHDKRWDTTEEGVYSLAPQSREVVKGLEKPLQLVYFESGNPGIDGRVLEGLKLFEYEGKENIRLEVVDPAAEPHLIDTYGMKRGNLLYLAYGEGEEKAVSRLNESDEASITNAIVRLTRGAAKKVYFVQGHGEPSIEDESPEGFSLLAQALDDEHIKVEEILLSKYEDVPDDAAALVLAAPEKALLDDERKMIIRYLRSGGRALFLTDPRASREVQQLAAQFMILVGNDVILDQQLRLFSGPTLGVEPLIASYDSEHPITAALSQNDASVFRLASSVRPLLEDEKDETFTKLALTGPNSWAETNLDALFDPQGASADLDDRDTQGPVSVAVAMEDEIGDEEGEAEGAQEDRKTAEKFMRLVVFGDSDWVRNANLGVYAHRDFVLNTVAWLIGEESSITIRPRSLRASVAPIQQETFTFILASSFLIPELLLIFGLFIWWRRKRVSH